MRSSSSTRIGLCSILFAILPVMVSTAAETDHQPTSNHANVIANDCVVSQPALDAINSATAEYVKQGRKNSQAGALIEEAKNAAWPPECDSVRARILAEKAGDLLEIDEDDSPPPSSSTIDKSLSTKFDGAWDFGLNAELIEQEGIQSTSFFDSLADDKYGLHIGKEFYRTEKWFLGGQVHIIRTNDSNVDDRDEIEFDSTSLFVTARHESLPALQFKLGLSRADYENFFESDTDSGVAYGIGLTTGNDDIRIHWLDYERHRIGNEEFDIFSVNLLIILCTVGVFVGGICF